ncbi:zinc finger protein 267-like isoform X1 [Hermetia illucens]|uniref:zinc finger protein 267-like isoform X1 n=1 Tax=Hermetia illucens TaxID=343691 RepID=UPI0018CC2B99|nr:zinc finger protein 267-like isoform X1 [Hermetia illucens]
MDCVPEKGILIAKDDFITPAQKLVFLKYMQLNTEFIAKPQDYPKLMNLLCAEHNKVCPQMESEEIVNIMESWVASVKSRFNQMLSASKTFVFSAEDVELLNLLNSDKQKPNSTELSCILDHLEIAYNSPKVWVTIGLEMEALGSKKSEDYWQKAFERWCNKVKRKKQILDEMDLQQSDKNSFLSALELRVLGVLEKIEANENKKANYFCRICIQSKDDDLKNIYEVYSDDLSLAQKISQCANVQEVSEDDNLPQYICDSCHQLLESAYKFKSLCEYSDQQLRLLAKSKVEYVEYIMEESTEYTTQTVEEEENTNEEISIEMNLSFENDLTLSDGNIIENEVNEQFEESSPTEKESKIVEDMDIHQCELCATICYNKATLKKHMNIHTFARPHSCTVCQKDFKTKLSLRIHMRSHTGERPYVCETCGKAFKTWSAVTNHRATHSTVKQFECQHCSYRSTTMANLKIHNRTHTGIQPYQCSQCPLKFSTASNRHKHIKNVHEKLKSHKCSTCSRTFFSRESARKHMVIHTGLKPYSCTECSMSYGWYNGLQKHMKTQHPGIKMPTEKHFLDLLEK